MRRFNILMFLSLIAGVTQAQFINNGATVTIQSGATLKVETDFQNNGTGTITNNGTIEVSGNFTNAGTATLTPGVGLVRFIGTGNSNLDTGGDALNNVEMAKTTSSGQVTLVAPATVGGNLSFTGTGNNKIVVVNFDLTMPNSASTVTATTNHTTNGYVVTDKTGTNTGSFVKGVASGMSTRTLEIGDDVNYSPVTMAVNASSAGTIKSRVITNAAPNPLTAKYAETTDFINREWVVSTTNLTTNTLTGTYADGDIVGTESLIKGATFHTGDWRFDGAAGVPASNTITATTATADVRFSGKNFFGKVNVKAFLQGAYSGGSMTTSLNSVVPANNRLEQFALSSPYADAPASVTAGFFLANPTIVDWVRLELRDPSAPSTTTTNKVSAFIKNNGDVVAIDGTSLPRIKNGFATSVVVLSHRNHLAVRTPNTGVNVVNPTQHNFSTGLGQAHFNPAITSNDAMVDLGSGVYGLFRGNPNGNASINSTDLSIVSTQSNPIQNGVYNSSDVNMNGSVNSTDLSVTSSASNPIKNAHN